MGVRLRDHLVAFGDLTSFLALGLPCNISIVFSFVPLFIFGKLLERKCHTVTLTLAIGQIWARHRTAWTN